MELTECPEMSVRDYSTLCNISEECRSHDDLVMQDLVWLRMIPFRAIQFAVVWLGASYANSRWHHIFKHQIWGKALVLHLSKCGISRRIPPPMVSRSICCTDLGCIHYCASFYSSIKTTKG